MDGISGELLYILIIAAIVLFQYVRQYLRRNIPPQDVQAEAPRAEDAAPEEPQSFELPLPVQHAQPSRAVHPVHQDMPRRPAGPDNPEFLPAKRFSRRALFGSKRRVQDAVVVAAILGPCRAFLPHDSAQ
jgi:hypothetical protein